MLRKTNGWASGAVMLWYLIAAANGWKGWTPNIPVTPHATGSSSGGHGSVYSGGWGGGK